MKNIILRFSPLILGIVSSFLAYYTNSNLSFIFGTIGGIFVLFGLLVASKSSMLGYGNNMQLLNGIGTTLYGHTDFNSNDKTYISTKWFVFLMLPIFPLGSYRVKKGETTTKFIGIETPYHMEKVKLNIGQVAKTFILSWGIIVTIIAFLIFR